MFLEIFPDLLRGCITTICLFCLFPVLSQPKIKRKTYIFIAIAVAVTDTLVCSLFYMNKDYTNVVYYSIVAYTAIVIGGKFLFRDKPLQWCFNCVTVLNIYAIIVVISYFLANLFPYPLYATTCVRVILFAAVILVFYKLVRPLYLEVSENWAAFLLPISGILAGYIYILLSLGDVENSMSKNIVYFLFLTLVTILTYIAIIISLKSLKQKYLLREDNIKRKATEELLTREIASYDTFLSEAKQNRHDIRHHNAIIAEYLETGDIKAAKEYLQLFEEGIKEGALKEYAKNATANAVFRIYDRRATENGITFTVHSEVLTDLDRFRIDIGIILSNLFENALEACKKCSKEEKYIYYASSQVDDSVLIEIRNSAESEPLFENGLPITTKKVGGTGLKSVKTIVEKYGGMIDVRYECNEFIIRLVIPKI